MKNLLITIFSLVVLLQFSGNAQEVIVTDDASYTTPANGAILDVKSVNKGLIIPRMTTAQRNTLGSSNPTPANGVMVFDSDLNAFYYWDVSAWKQIAASGLNLTGYKFGDATNYATFESDGTLALYGTATVWDDLMVPSIATRTSTNPPDWAAFLGGTFLTYFGNIGNAANEQQVFFAVQFPHSWASDTIFPHVHWTPEDNGAATTDSVRWGFEYTWAEYSPSTPVTFPSTTIIYCNDDAPTNGADKHLIAGFPAIIPSTSQDYISSMMVCRLFRNSSAAVDTYAGRAGFLQFDIHFKKNTEGSHLPFTK